MSDRQITAPPRALHVIMEHVANKYDVSVAALKSKRRIPREVRPRQIAMYLSREMTFCSLRSIAAQYRRDASTVKYSIRAVEDWIAHSAEFAGDINQLTAELKPKLDVKDAYESTIDDMLDRLRARLLVAARRDPVVLLQALSSIADGGE